MPISRIRSSTQSECSTIPSTATVIRCTSRHWSVRTSRRRSGAAARLRSWTISTTWSTPLFDLTGLTTPGGRALLHKLGGAAGDEIAESYVKVLAATGVKGYPFVKTHADPKPGSEDAFLGVRVDNDKLMDLNAYLVSLPAPAGATVDAEAVGRGRDTFRSAGCTTCHNVDQSKFVPPSIVPMKTIFPGDNPTVLAQREPPLNPVQDTPGNTFDDKMAVVNASIRGGIRGIALPLLLDLARKPVFLHDDSVSSLEDLLMGSADRPLHTRFTSRRIKSVTM